jgi:hypothetical protein
MQQKKKSFILLIYCLIKMDPKNHDINHWTILKSI